MAKFMEKEVLFVSQYRVIILICKVYIYMYIYRKRRNIIFVMHFASCQVAMCPPYSLPNPSLYTKNYTQFTLYNARSLKCDPKKVFMPLKKGSRCTIVKAQLCS